MSTNWEHLAGVLWPFLVDAAENRDLPTYSDLAPIIDQIPLNVGRALGPLFYHCANSHIPPLTSIVVGKNTHIPGGGFVALGYSSVEEAQEAAYAHNWGSEVNPFGGFGRNDTIDRLGEKLCKRPDRAGDIYAKARVRGTAQAIFRAALLRAYEAECAICGLSFEEALEAAHIIPWGEATPAERVSPTNGVLLCANHHKLLDSGWIRLNSDHTMSHIDHEFDADCYGDADLAATAAKDGTKINLPSDKRLWPSREAIGRRNSRRAR